MKIAFKHYEGGPDVAYEIENYVLQSASEECERDDTIQFLNASAHWTVNVVTRLLETLSEKGIISADDLIRVVEGEKRDNARFIEGK